MQFIHCVVICIKNFCIKHLIDNGHFLYQIDVILVEDPMINIWSLWSKESCKILYFTFDLFYLQSWTKYFGHLYLAIIFPFRHHFDSNVCNSVFSWVWSSSPFKPLSLLCTKLAKCIKNSKGDGSVTPSKRYDRGCGCKLRDSWVIIGAGCIHMISTCVFYCILYIHTLRVHYAHAAANLNSGYSKYAKVARVHYFCTIALRTSRAVVTRAWASRRVDSFSKRVIIFCW